MCICAHLLTFLSFQDPQTVDLSTLNQGARESIAHHIAYDEPLDIHLLGSLTTHAPAEEEETEASRQGEEQTETPGQEEEQTEMPGQGEQGETNTFAVTKGTV